MTSNLYSSTMDIIQIYATTVAAIGAALLIRTLGWRLLRIIYYHWRPKLKYVCYAILVRRRYWGSVTWLQSILLSGYVIANGFAMGLDIHNIQDLIRRTGLMATVNMVPLFLGGRTSVLAQFMGISIHSYYLFHHWIGRIVAIQGMLHFGLLVATGQVNGIGAFQISGITVR
jgi:hypothetical protein